MQLIIARTPTCGSDWTSMTTEHIESFPHRELGTAEKNTNAIRRRFNLLVRRSKTKPTGDPNIPPELAYARQASKAIVAAAGVDGLPDDDSDFGESGNESDASNEGDDDESSDAQSDTDDGDKKPAAKKHKKPAAKKATASAKKSSAKKPKPVKTKPARPSMLTSTPLISRRSSGGGRETPSFLELMQMQSAERAEREDRRFRMELEQRQREAEDRRQHQQMMMMMMSAMTGNRMQMPPMTPLGRGDSFAESNFKGPDHNNDNSGMTGL